MLWQWLFLVASSIWSASCVVIDHPDSFPSEWVKVGRTDPDQAITLGFAVAQQNVERLREILLEVSTPYTPQYGKFWAKDDVLDLVKPTQESIDIVKAWLRSKVPQVSVASATSNSDVLSIETTVSVAESLLQCEYYDFEYDGWTVSRVDGFYHVPSYVAPHLDFVTPTHRFPPVSRGPRVSVKSDTATTVTPTVLRALYNIGDAKGTSGLNNSQGVASFQDQLYSKDDLSTFWSDFDIDACTVIDVPDGERSGYHLEAELDTQYISAMGEGITMQVWYTKGLEFDDALLEWTNDVIDSDDRPLLFSASYGAVESYYGASYIDRLNTQFAIMGTLGMSVLFASGDSGAGGGCSSAPYEPDYPASSPYVTAVGGVTGGTAGETPLGESVWVDGGGGFSNYSPIQSWQLAAVTSYLENAEDLPDSKYYNNTGRGYPDIAAQSVDFEIIVDGKSTAVSGTSCASPTAAGVFALLNDLRVANGMSPMGFLNPFIYSTAESDSTAFNDCTDGYNKGCSRATNKGFSAATGWDAASGYGSPNYEVLKTYVLKTGLSTRR